MEKEKYFIGLDIGTNSCGWAVTNKNYELCKDKHGKSMWGVRLFKEGEVALNRRAKRTNRRRLDRRKLKIQWLQEIFEEEIQKIDPDFFMRLKYSSLWWQLDGEEKSDKEKAHPNLISKDSLFAGEINGKPYSDKDYFKDYKTIYHLREKLTKSPAEDIRLLYLAIHNIIKHRGHFLIDEELDAGESIDVLGTMQTCFEMIKSIFEDDELNSWKIETLNKEDESQLKGILKPKSNKKDKKKNLCNLFRANSKDEKEIISSLVDGSLDIKKLQCLKDKLPKDKAKNTDFKLNFDDSDDFMSKVANISGYIEHTDWLMALRKLYINIHALVLFGGDEDFICKEMVKRYENHKKQLKEFKDFLKKYYPKQVYFNMFRLHTYKEKDKKEKVYPNYTYYINNFGKVKGKTQSYDRKEVKAAQKSKSIQEQFYHYVLEVIEQPLDMDNREDSDFIEIKKEIKDNIENKNFLPLLRTKENVIIPNQCYEKELKRILEVNAEKFSFLLEKDNTAIDAKSNKPLNNIDKILQILKFRVPYYVGPIVDENKVEDGQKHSWIEKKSNLSLRPWTLEKIVDIDQAENNFITRMTRKCTYLIDEDVLPKNSLLYSKYCVLNELNKLKIKDNPISVEEKQAIFTNVFLQDKSPTIKKIITFFESKGMYDKGELTPKDFSGIDKTFKNNMSVIVQLAQIFGMQQENDALKVKYGLDFIEKNEDLVEKIILWMTIIEDKKRLQKRLENLEIFLSDNDKQIKNDQIKAIKGISCSGWGKLSSQFLNMVAFDMQTGESLKNENFEPITIIERLWNTNDNLMQIIEKYKYSEFLDADKKQDSGKITYQDVNALYCSPMVKRGVWQAIQILQEIIEIQGYRPDKIFVEVTRHDAEKGEKGRKVSRKDKLKTQYENIKKATDACKQDLKELKELENQLENKGVLDFRSDKLFLYFAQKGRCIYTNKPIAIEALSNNSEWDIDHIYPQSKIKDESIDNKVLVHKTANGKKGDGLIAAEHRQLSLWKKLLKQKLMSEEKYNRLIKMSTTDLTDEDLNGFLQRQLVVTNQSNKAVIDLIKFNSSIVANATDVVYSKAIWVKAFKDCIHSYNSQIQEAKQGENQKLKDNIEEYKIDLNTFKEYNFIKSRAVNDFHHARDAYLNIVAGNILSNRFNHFKREQESYNINNSKENGEKTATNIERVFWNKVYAVDSKSQTNKQSVWNGLKSIKYPKNNHLKNTDLIDKIAETYAQNDILISKFTFCNENGEFYDSTIYKKLDRNSNENKKSLNNDEDSRLIPLKAKYNAKGEENPFANTARYGGYKSAKNAFFVVIEAEKSKKIYRRIEGIPTYLYIQYKRKYKNEENCEFKALQDIINLICEQRGLKNPKFICKLKKHSTLQIDNGLYWLGGGKERRIILHNANQWYTSNEITKYVKALEKYQILKEDRKLPNNLDNHEQVILSPVAKKSNSAIIFTKEKNLVLYEAIQRQLQKNIYRLSCWNTLIKLLDEQIHFFKELSILEQVEALLGIIQRLKSGAKSASVAILTNKKLSETTELIIPKNITGKYKIYLIKTSVTGLKTTKIRLDKVNHAKI